MTIARIQAFAVRYPEPNNDDKIRSLTLVRVEADDGQVGWGEAITGDQETSLAVAIRSPSDGSRRSSSARIRRDVGALWQPDARRDLLGRQRRASSPSRISALDMALWDLKGRIEGRSLSEMLGGATARAAARRAPARSSTATTSTGSARSSGVPRPGLHRREGRLGPRPVDRVRTRRVARPGDRPGRARRHRAGRRHDLRRRGAGGLDARACDPHGPRGSTTRSALYWLEDPLPEQDLDGYRALRAARRHAHLHRREGLDRRPLPAPYRFGRAST